MYKAIAATTALIASLALAGTAQAQTVAKMHTKHHFTLNDSRWNLRVEEGKESRYPDFGNTNHGDCLFAAVGYWDLMHGVSAPTQGQALSAYVAAGGAMKGIGGVDVGQANAELSTIGIAGQHVYLADNEYGHIATLGNWEGHHEGHAVYVLERTPQYVQIISWGEVLKVATATFEGYEPMYWEVENI